MLSICDSIKEILFKMRDFIPLTNTLSIYFSIKNILEFKSF